jgi:aspartokinase
VADAKLLEKLDYETAIDIVRRSRHAILHQRSIELARRNGLPLRILPFAEPDAIGSWIGHSTCTRPSEAVFEV